MPRSRRSWPSTQASVCEPEQVFAEEDENCYNDSFVFDPHDEAYLCLCGHSHCATGVRLVICLLLFTLIFEFYDLCVSIVYQKGLSLKTISSLVNLLLGGFLTVCLILALKLTKAIFLLPYLVIQIAGLISTLVFTFAFLYMSNVEDRRLAENFGVILKDEYSNASFWLRAGTFLIMSIIQMWLITVVLGCFRYLRDLSRPHLAINLADIEATSTLRRSASAEAIERPRKKLLGKSLSVSAEKSSV